MRRQYLGDEKDAFKWDYHHYLARKLGVDVFRVMFMLTGNDDERPWEGRSDPRNFKGADERIYSLCEALKFSKTEDWMFLDVLRELPGEDGGYRVQVDRDAERGFCADENRERYFGAFASGGGDELIFIDPNTGFEPVAGATCDHVRYDEIEHIASQASPNSLVSVFQGFAYRSFAKHYESIKKKLPFYSAALYWNGAGKGGLMFVVVSRSAKRIAEAAEWNGCYEFSRPVVLLSGDAA